VVAKVNGEIITLSELQTRQIETIQREQVAPDNIVVYLRQHNAKILQDAIDDLLIVQRALEFGKPVPPEYLKEVIEGIKKDNNIKSDEELVEQLRREGLSLGDLKRNIERSLLRRQALAHDVEPLVSVTENDARMDYEARKAADYTQPATVHLAEIRVGLEGAEGLARATAIVKRARAGEDFAQLAREVSSALTRAAGGDLGWFARQDINRGMAKAIDGLTPGQIADPLPVKNGYQILKLVELTQGKVTPFDDVRQAILDRLTGERRVQEYGKYIVRLRKDALITQMVREIPIPNAILSAPLSSTLNDPVALDTVSAAPLAGAKPADDSEFAVTPMAKPKKIVPGQAQEPKADEDLLAPEKQEP
jgi:peptidyl-prolyl cis-trans isomerase SurA